jgi:hypothetical protein
MWTGIFPKRKDYNYEIRFRTDNEYAYKLVQEACREAIDTDCANESPAPENKKEIERFRWLRVDNKVYDITKTPVVEIDCECDILTHRFDIQDMIDNWNTAGIFTCGECHRRITYELLK